MGTAVRGQPVEEGVRGGVVRLPRGAQHARGRRVEHEGGEIGLPGQLVQVPRRVGLRPGHRPQPRRGQPGDGGVVEDTSRVDHSGERVDAGDGVQESGQRVTVGDVDGSQGDGRAQLGELGDERRGTVRPRPAAADQQQMPHVVVGDQPAGGQPAERPRPAGDQDRAVGIEPAGHG